MTENPEEVNNWKPIMDITEFRSFAGGLDHPECVTWGPDGFAYAGGEGGQIYKVSLEGQVEKIADTSGFILGLCLDESGNIYACDVAKNQVLKITQSGEISMYADGILSPNYPIFDRSGNLYVTGSGIAGENNAALYRILRNGEVTCISEEVCQTANGLALSPEEDYLYVVLSETSTIVRLAIHRNGSIGHPEQFITLDNAVPDGIAVDEEGSLYIGCYTPDIIYKLDLKRNLFVLAQDWKRNTLASPTNLVFGGSERNLLLVSNFARWDLVMAQMTVKGKPLNYPDMSLE